MITSPSAAQAGCREAIRAAAARAVKVGRGRGAGREEETEEEEERMANQSKKQMNAKTGPGAPGDGAHEVACPHAPTGRVQGQKRKGDALGSAGWLEPDACQARWAGGGSRAANGQRTCWAVKGPALCGAMVLGSAGECGWRAGTCARPASSAWVRHQAQVACISSL